MSSFLKVVGCLALVGLFCGAAHAADLTVFILDVGQGNCIFVVQPNNELWLVDCGSSSDPAQSVNDVFLSRFLNNRRLPLARMVITHGDSDHFNLVPTFDLLGGRNATIGGIYAGGPQTDYIGTSFESWWLSTTTRWPITFLQPNQHDSAGTGDGAWLLTASVGSDKNSHSAVYKFANRGSSIMLTGDATNATLGWVVDNYKSTPGFLLTNVMIAPHHGANVKGDSNLRFIDETKPEAVVFTAGYDSIYGHPRCAAAALFVNGSPRFKAAATHNFTCYNARKRIGQPLVNQHVLSLSSAAYNTGGAGALAVTITDNGWRLARCPGNDPTRCVSPVLGLAATTIASDPLNEAIPVSLSDLIEIGVEPNFRVKVTDRESDPWNDLLDRDCNLTAVSPDTINADCSAITPTWNILPNDQLQVGKLVLNAGSSTSSGFAKLTGEVSVIGETQQVTVMMSAEDQAFKTRVPPSATFAGLLDYLGKVAGLGELASRLPCPLLQFASVPVLSFTKQDDLTVKFATEPSVQTASSINKQGTLYKEVRLNSLTARTQRIGGQTKSQICVSYTYFGASLRSCASNTTSFDVIPCPNPPDPPPKDDPKEKKDKSFWEALKFATTIFVAAALDAASTTKELPVLVAATVSYASGFFTDLFGAPDAIDGDAPSALKTVFEAAKERVGTDLTVEHVVAGANNAGSGPKAIIAAAASEFHPAASALVAAVVSAKPSTDLAVIGAALVAAYGYNADAGGASSLTDALKGVQPDRAKVLAAVFSSFENLSLSAAALAMTHAYTDLQPSALARDLGMAKPGTSATEMASSLAIAYSMKPSDAGRLLSVLALVYTLDPMAAARATQASIDPAHGDATSLVAALVAQYGFTAVPRDVAPAALALRAAGYTHESVADALTKAFGNAWSAEAATRVSSVFTDMQWQIAIETGIPSANLNDLAVSVRRLLLISPESMVVLLTAVGNFSTLPAGQPLAAALALAGYDYVEANRAALAFYGGDAWRKNGFVAFSEEWKARGGSVVPEH